MVYGSASKGSYLLTVCS